MASVTGVALPTRPRPRPRSRSDSRPSTAPAGHPSSSAHNSSAAVPVRPPRSFSRPSPPKLNIDRQPAKQQSTPRIKTTSNLALQARDSVSVRKRTMSTGAMSGRVARQNARRADADLLQPSSRRPNASPSDSIRGRSRSRSPAGTPSTRTNSHRNRRARSPSPSSSSPSQSPTPITPGHPSLSGAPSSYHVRPRTHVPHNSQGTTTSAYPPSSSQSSRSSSPSPERSRTPSPGPPTQKSPSDSLSHTPMLDLDPDDVNARLRLLVNNNYFLPPAHAKPELSPIYLTPSSSKGATSPSAFKEFFRVGRKKEKKMAEINGFTSPNGRRGLSPTDSPQPLSSGPDGRYGVTRHGDGYFDLQPPSVPTRSRVVVVRETVNDLPPPAIRAPFRTSSLQAHTRPRTAPQPTYIDPTTQYDMPPPTHYPSFTNLRIDAAGIAGNVELDQFAPPGEPWSPMPSPRSHSGSRSGSGSGMDQQERVWRRAILEQAVDLSWSSAASDPGHVSLSLHEGSFTRGARVNNEYYPEPTSPTSLKSPKSKKSWWGRREKEAEDVPQRLSTSSSNKDRDIPRNSGSEHVSHGFTTQVQAGPTPQQAIYSVGQRILPNVHAELEQLEREQALREREQNAGLPPPLRLKPLRPFGAATVSAPATPIHQLNSQNPPTPSLPLTPLRPRPAHRRGEARRDLNAFGEHVTREFMPGHSTIRKSLSTPLLSDLHETGVDVDEPIPFASSSSDSLEGVAAPSLVLHDPHGVQSLVASHTADSITSGSHYSEDDHEIFDPLMTPHEQAFGLHDDDGESLERWNTSLSTPGQGEGRPSFDSFGAGRVRSPEGDCPARASSTFGFRRSNISVSTPSPLRPHQDIEVDISGDPIEHLSMMESQRSVSPGAESQESSAKGYASALDHTFAESDALSVRPSSPASVSYRSTRTRLASVNSQPERPEPPAETATPAPISFFDSVQHQSYMDEDNASSDSDGDVDEPPDVQFTSYPERPSLVETLGRKSLNTTRPTPAFATQFRNASQPQLPLSRAVDAASLESTFRPIRPYDHLDRKKPLTNTPLSTSPVTSSGILSQFKAKPGKGRRPFSSRGKTSVGPSMVLPESTFDLLRYPHGTAFSLGSGAGTMTGSEADSAEAGSINFEGVRSQGSLPSMRSSAVASLKRIPSWRQEQSNQDESLRKLDGMLLQHLEAEKDRLRKIASAAREKGGSRDRYS